MEFSGKKPNPSPVQNSSEKSLKEELKERINEDYHNAVTHFENETDALYKDKLSTLKSKREEMFARITTEENTLLLEQKNMERLLISIQNKKSELENFFAKTTNLLDTDKSQRMNFVLNCLETEALRQIDSFSN
jgi:uncharacterized membrane-anchored protein YhcB (DUF1043 family)